MLYYRGDAGIPNRCFTFAIRESSGALRLRRGVSDGVHRMNWSGGVALVSGLPQGLTASHKAAVQVARSSGGVHRLGMIALSRRQPHEEVSSSGRPGAHEYPLAPAAARSIFSAAQPASIAGCPAGCAWPKRAAVPAHHEHRTRRYAGRDVSYAG